MGDAAHERGATLKRLEMLAGKWDVELVHPSDPSSPIRTQASFEWIDEGHFFLVHRAGSKGSDFPMMHSVIGADDGADAYTVLYSDSRGMTRIYQMSLTNTEWQQWRDQPDFRQRFSAAISADGRTMKGTWEIAEGDDEWRHDFAVTYTRVD